jgi:hypothetical protein
MALEMLSAALAGFEAVWASFLAGISKFLNKSLINIILK